mgnify:CR=1 FL=1
MSKELCWYENYSLDLDVINPNKYNDQIARLNIKMDDKTMETKINKIVKTNQHHFSHTK